MHPDESADILGGRLQVSPPRPPLWSDPGRITLYLGVAAVVAFVWAQVAPHYRQWRETRYRKAMRRRHGIPDDDHRPFNVAYAAALQARKRKEGKNNGGTQRSAPPVTVEDEVPQTIGATTGHFPLPSYAGASAGHEDGIRLGESSAFAGPSVLSAAQSSASHYGSTSQATVRYPPLGRHNVAPPAHHGKHALDDEVDARHESSAKKSRLEVEELLDGGDVSERQVNGMDVDQHTGHIKRGSKRVASLEDDEGLDASRVDRRDKRARKVSIDKSAIAEDYDMEDDEQEDELDGNPSIVRGKKRDRAEAGSTFGGDDSVIDDDEKPQRQRRRRTVSNKLSQSSSRGQKRVRDLDSYDSDDSADRLKREHTRKKRGKRSEEEEVPVSHDPLCKGRHIGEEWESNGIRYKVGPNGQRLRQELVKKSRSRFPMPSDSQHPDRRANVDVYVETWLTEEEYQAAKERHELAWQDSSLSPEPHTQLGVPDSPTKAGKNLLWSSTMSSRESPAKRGALRQSIGPGANLRLSILSPAPVSTSRLISSVYQAPASPASDSPKLQKTKSYSKWEKQDLEAAAMSKIREKQQQQQQAKATSFPAASSTPNPGFFGATATPATAAKPAETSSQPSAPSFSFAPASTSGSANKSATEPPKLNVPTSAPASAPSGQSKPAGPLFPFPSSTGSGSTSTPSAAAPTPPTQTQPAAAKSDAQSASSIPNFFAKPAAPASAPAPPTVPNFFAKPATQTTSSGGAPTAGSQAPAAPKTAFSFAPTTAPTQPQAYGSPVSNGSAKPEEAKQVPGGSLLSRLGMGPHPAAQAQVPAATTSSFAKPASSTPGAASGATTDAAKSATTTPASGSSAPGNAASEPLKFSFGAPSKAATPAYAANGTTSTASTTAGTTSAATSAPKFSFGVTGTSAQSGAAGTTAASSPFQTNPAHTSNTNATNASSAPKSAFSIGNSSAAPAASPFAGNAGASNSSPFGAPAGNSSSTTKASPFGAPSSGNQPSPFGAPSGTASTNNASPFGAPSGTAAASGSSPFGAPTATAASTNNASPFGTPSTTNNASPFGTTTGPNPSPFGPVASGAAKPAEAPKSAFSFGAPTSASNTSAKPAEAPKSAFAFGTTNGPSSGSILGGNTTQNSSAPKADTKPTPTFGTPSTSTPTFGAPSSTPTFGASSSAPIFGSPANASGTNGKPAFSFGASNTTASSPFGGASTTNNKTDSKPSFGFGTSNNATSAGNSTAAPASPFSFGAQASSNNATTPAASSPFGNTQQGSSSFSFGAPSGAFSFSSSSNANQNTQK